MTKVHEFGVAIIMGYVRNNMILISLYHDRISMVENKNFQTDSQALSVDYLSIYLPTYLSIYLSIYIVNGGFRKLKWGHMHFHRIFHYKPSSELGDPPLSH